jgi:hypothetical protein
MSDLDPEGPVWAEIMDVAGQDPARAVVVSLALRRLASGAKGELLKEMAESVLSGRTSLRQAAASDAYGQAIATGFDRFWSRYEGLSEAQQRRAVEKGDAQLRRIRTRLAARGIKPMRH